MEPSGAARPSPEVVYQLAGALGTELQGLASRFGSETVARLVPHVVRALELLEGAAAGAPLELEEGKKEGEGTGGRAPRRPQPELRSENEEVRERLRDGPQDERLLLRQLKQVIDRQRDQLRAQRGELQLRGQEAEALQEQLQRLLRVNGELRCKLAAVQVQLRAALQRAAAAEGAPSQAGAPEAPEACAEAAPRGPGKDGFSREEVSQILQERNELKANVFLLQEELDYYHRELLADRRVPGLLLTAMKSAVKKQRRKIKAKMLGTVEEPGSSEDEDEDEEEDEETSWLPRSDVDGASPPAPPESRIRSFFSLWYRGSPEPSAELSPTGEPPCSQGELKEEEEEPPPAPPEPSGATL
ncbi:rab-interacting lysosomal protein isoform X3 [Antechinus flavipes]|uniref:rab-interacting lysosomal protein isoform X3 n=1 Tax=Antechinus flavipes TaxID=38775 RepID=UPI002235E4AC|nr:rab-interacting lysosomal protein isoform X3 [Antechinus flavipes]